MSKLTRAPLWIAPLFVAALFLGGCSDPSTVEETPVDVNGFKIQVCNKDLVPFAEEQLLRQRG